MGTRNSTLVYLEGKTKVAQYGQWDGYPTGQGITIAEFLKTADIAKFKKQVKALKAYTPKELEEIYKDLGFGTDWITVDQANELKRKHPELSRDFGAGILELIYQGKVTKVSLYEDFKDEKLFCEYYYELDLDNETISVNGGTKYQFKDWTIELMKKLDDDRKNS